MSATAAKPCCVTCGNEITVFKCESCFQTAWCNQSDASNINEQTRDTTEHELLQKVNVWESSSIIKIRQTAEEARQIISKHTTERISVIQGEIAKIDEQLRKSRADNSFATTSVCQLQEKLAQVLKQLEIPSNITVRQVSVPLVMKIHVDISPLVGIPNISADATWNPTGITVAGGNAAGDELNQLNTPYGHWIDDDGTIYAADYLNHRIVAWKIGAASGEIVAGGNGRGNQQNQLNLPTDIIIDKESDSLIICEYGNKRVVQWPRQNGASGKTIVSNIGCFGLCMDSNGYFYISDYDKHEVRRWKMGDRNATVVAGGNGGGNRTDQLDRPTYISVDQDHSVYISDSHNHRVMKWIEGAKEGIVVAGGQVAGSSPTQLNCPLAVGIDQLGNIYVVDRQNHRVIRWLKGANSGTVVVGGNGQGTKPNQLSLPYKLSFDHHGNLYISEFGNHRVQKFNRDPSSNT